MDRNDFKIMEMRSDLLSKILDGVAKPVDGKYVEPYVNLLFDFKKTNYDAYCSRVDANRVIRYIVVINSSDDEETLQDLNTIPVRFSHGIAASSNNKMDIIFIPNISKMHGLDRLNYINKVMHVSVLDDMTPDRIKCCDMIISMYYAMVSYIGSDNDYELVLKELLNNSNMKHEMRSDSYDIVYYILYNISGLDRSMLYSDNIFESCISIIGKAISKYDISIDDIYEICMACNRTYSY